MASTGGRGGVKPTTQQGIDDAFDDLLKAEETPTAAAPTLTYEKVKTALTRAYEVAVANGDNLKTFVKMILDTADRRFADDKATHRQFRVHAATFLKEVRDGKIVVEPEQDEEAAPDKEDEAERKAEKRRKARLEREKSEHESEFQVDYIPGNNLTSVQTLVPRNQQTAIDRALASLIAKLKQDKAYANLDDKKVISAFVADSLGLELKNLGKYLSAEQADAIAFAIDNVDQGSGFIIGDQTGVGKGRVVAAMIMYAKKQGMTPIFMTKEPGLYADMYRDLNDITWLDFEAIVSNRDLKGTKKIPLPDRKAMQEEDAGRLLGTEKEHNRFITEMTRTGKLPEGFDALFTSYSQMQTVAKNETIRHVLLRALIPNAFIILDESHEAAGGEAIPVPDPVTGQIPLPRSEFIRELVGEAKAVMYSSATFAKRPKSMSLYSRTNMVQAVANAEELETVMQSGGVPLQQVVSQMLVEDNQYIRREKSFKGIDIPTVEVPVDVDLAESATSATRDIFLFDDNVIPEPRTRWALQIAAENGGVASDGSISMPQSTSFASMMHNIVKQGLLALKADAIADQAIEAFERGEKPIVTVSNTMGAFLSDYMDATEAHIGDPADIRFNDVFLKYLDRAREVTLTNPITRVKTRFQMTREDMIKHGGQELFDKFDDLQSKLEALDLSDMAASPLDHILKRMRDAGMKVGEITGRDKFVNLNTGLYEARESSAASKKREMNQYNSGALDALLLNRSGSTGFSLHASNQYKDTKPRRMIIGQAEDNIDTFVQLLGRINRTGQIELPLYTILVANLPSEVRPAALLSQKLKKLNANTSSASKTAISTETEADLFNEVGGGVVQEYLAQTPGLAAALGISTTLIRDGGEKLVAAVTGKANLLPIKKDLPITTDVTLPSQIRMFKELTELYIDRIEQLDAMGENPLEAKSLDLEATVLSSNQLTAQGDTDSVFARPAYLDKVEVNRLIKPLTEDQLYERWWKGIPQGMLKTPAPPAVSAVQVTPGPVDTEIDIIKGPGGRTPTEGVTDLGVERPDPEMPAEENRAKETKERIKQYHAELRAHVQGLNLDFTMSLIDRRTRAQEAVKAAEQGSQDREIANADLKKIQKRIEDRTDHINRIIQKLDNTFVGDVVQLTSGPANNEVHAQGFVAKVLFKHKAKDPLALNNFEFEIALADGDTAVLKVRGAQILRPLGSADDHRTPMRLERLPVSRKAMFETMERGARVTREERRIITGNLLAGYSHITSGQFVMYTDDSGDINSGVLLPRDFSDTQLGNLPVALRTAEHVVEYLAKTGTQGIVEASDDSVEISATYGGGYYIRIRSRGGRRIYTNARLREIVVGKKDDGTPGDFRSRTIRGKKVYVAETTDAAALRSAVEHLIETLGVNFQTNVDKKTARKITGEPDPTQTVQPPSQLGGSTARLATTNDQPKLALAWHGGPHDHDRFSTDYIGTGQGAQAQGWGLYFAGAKGVAEWHQRSITDRTQVIQDKVATTTGVQLSGSEANELAYVAFSDEGSLTDGAKRLYARVPALRKISGGETALPGDQPRLETLLSDIRGMPFGRLYKVNLAPAEDEYLYWDKPFIKQSEKVKAALLQLSESDLGAEQFESRENLRDMLRGMDNNATGSGLYGFLKAAFGSARAASLALRDAGIPGIKYLDEQSRGAPPTVRDWDARWTASGTKVEVFDRKTDATVGDTVFDSFKEADAWIAKNAPKITLTYNYVIFDDSNVEIEAKLSATARQQSPETSRPVNGGQQRAIVEMIQDELARIAPTAKLEIVPRLLVTSARAAEASGGTPDSVVLGQYAHGVITMAYQSLGSLEQARTVTGHEGIHFLREAGFFTDREWRALEARSRESWIRRFSLPQRPTDDSVVEEGIAYAYEDWLSKSGRVPNVAPFHGLFRRMLIFFRRIANVLRLRGFQTEQDIFGRVQEGTVGRRRTRKRSDPTADTGPKLSLGRPAAPGGHEATISRIIGNTDKTLVGWVKDLVRDHKERGSLEEKQGFLDAFASIEALEKADNSGELKDAQFSPFKAAHGTQNLMSVMGAVLRYGPLKIQEGWFALDESFGKGFEEIFDGLAKSGKLRLWKAWAVANRAQRLKAEGRENLLTDEEIAELLPLGDEHPEFNDVMKEWTEFNKRMLNMAEKTGLINSEQRSVWEKSDYVPFFRIHEETAQGGGKGKRGLEGQRSGIRTLTGGESQINDPIENMVMGMTSLVDRSFKNLAMRKVWNLAKNAGVLESMGPEWKPALIPATEAVKKMKKRGIDVGLLSKSDKKQMIKMFQMTAPQGPDVVSVMIAGKPQYARVLDPLLLRSITSLSPVQLGGMMKIMRMAKRVLTTGVTIDPTFMLRNFVRDTVSAWVTAGQKNFRPGYDSARGFAKALKGDVSLGRLMASGAGSGGFYRTDPEDVRKLMDAKYGVDEKRVLDTPKKLWEFYQRVGQASEAANRIAIFEAVIKSGGTKAEAAYQARDVMDFAMRGDYAAMRFLAETVPFLNARAQGIYRLYRGGKQNPVGFLLRGSMVMAATLAVLAANWDDPKYEELEEWDKDANFHFWVDGVHYRLPKPFEVGAIFSTIPERMIRAMSGRDSGKVATERLLSMFSDTFAMNPTPQLFKPLVEQWANKVGFTNRPIVGIGLERLVPEAQHSPWTSETARLLGRALPGYVGQAKSPKRIEHIIRGYFGTLGTYVLSASDSVVRLFGDYPDKPSPRIDDYPIVKAFVRGDPARSTVYLTRFYELQTEVNKVRNSMLELQKRHASDEVIDSLRGKTPHLKYHKLLNQVRSRLAGINRAIRRIYENRSMSPDRKRIKIDGLIHSKNTLARNVMRSIQP